MHPTQNGNELSSTPAPTPPNQWARLAFTILPFFVYLLAERIPLPSIGAMYLLLPWGSFETYSIVALGIMPWIIASAIVEIVAVVIPRWQPLRYGGVSGRAKLRRAANILGLLLVALQAYSITRLLTFEPTIAVEPSWEFYVPYQSSLIPSPVLVFAALVAGAILVKLLADLITHRGLAHGYAVFFVGGLLVSALRTIGRENRNPEWMNSLLLSASALACGVLTLFILIKFRSIKSDKPKDPRMDNGDINNPYAPPIESGASARPDSTTTR